MRTVLIGTWLLPLIQAAAPAQPAIQQAGNAFGLRPASSIHNGIARGGLMAILGDHLGPEDEVDAAAVPDPALGGVSVELATADQSFDLPLVSASRTSVVALVPRDAPSGAASVIVTYAGSTSQPASVQIVDYTFGLATQLPISHGLFGWSGGYGPAFASNVVGDSSPLNTLLNPAGRGQQVILYGTGLGVDGPAPVVWVGNSQAQVLDAGPTGCCAGIEQIQIVIPEGIEGCYVPVAVQIGDTISNFSSLAISSAGEACSDPLSYTRDELEAIRGMDTVRLGVIEVDRTVTGSNYGKAKFLEYDRDALLRSVSVFGMPPFGTCTVNPPLYSYYINLDTSMDPRGLNDPPEVTGRGLDAGRQDLLLVNKVSYPNRVCTGNVFTLKWWGLGKYWNFLFTGSHQCPPLDAGSLEVTSFAGDDVGAFQADQHYYFGGAGGELGPGNWVPGEPSPVIYWPNSLSFSSQPQPYKLLRLGGGEQVMLCPVSWDATSFQVPGFVTLAIAWRNPDGSVYIPPRSAEVWVNSLPARFTAPGIDLGVFFSHVH